jgi:hypothetical protein
MDLHSTFGRIRAALLDLFAVGPRAELPVFTQAEWDRKWCRYVESVGREAVRDAEKPYTFQVWIQRSGRAVGFEMSPAIMRPPMVVARGMLPIPARPPFGTRAQLDALCVALQIKLEEQMYLLEHIEQQRPGEHEPNPYN